MILIYQPQSTFNAIRSVSRSDDEALIQQMLSGDDLFTLSDDDDVIDGYAGDDRFETGLGNDVIDGGSGTDTVKFLGNYADYSYSYSSQTNSSTFSKAGDTKIVSNVENFIFNDSTYSLSQINDLNIQNNTPSVDVPSYSNSGVIIDADYSIDLMNINFNRIYKASYDFANTYQTQSWTISRNETADWGQTYNYAIGLVQKSGSNLLGALFGGDYVNYSVASNGDLIINSGNLQAFGEVFLDAYGNSTNWYSIRNFDYNGKSIFDAMEIN